VGCQGTQRGRSPADGGHWEPLVAHSISVHLLRGEYRVDLRLVRKGLPENQCQGTLSLYCSSSHRQRAHEGRQLARMAGVSEVIEAAKIPSALSEVGKAIESFQLAEDSPMADALKVASRSLASSSTFASLRTPEFQNLFKNVAAQGSSPIVRDAMKSFAAVKVPADILGINNFKIAGLFDQVAGDQFRSLSKTHTSALAASLADINRQHSIVAALGAFDSAVLVKNLVPEVEWIKAFGASSAVNAILAESVGGLSSLAEEIASTTARLSTLSPPKAKWFENVDLGINSWPTWLG
jgi:hypothetical protein